MSDPNVIDRLRDRAPRGDRVTPNPPSQAPMRDPIEGRWTLLRPVDPASDGAALFAASHRAKDEAETLWRYMPYGPFADESAFRTWLDGAAASTDPLFYAIVDRASGKPIGMASYLNIHPNNGSIEIGHIWFGTAVQRSRVTTESLYLMMRHAMDGLKYRRLEWKCNALNDPSRRAARRLGFRYEGIFYKHLVVKGHNRDTAWYSILDDEWAPIRAAFEAWCDPANFDAAGQQKKALATGVRT
jgi:RimJ/RimL family protein N-acetyltransferase